MSSSRMRLARTLRLARSLGAGDALTDEMARRWGCSLGEATVVLLRMERYGIVRGRRTEAGMRWALTPAAECSPLVGSRPESREGRPA